MRANIAEIKPNQFVYGKSSEKQVTTGIEQRIENRYREADQNCRAGVRKINDGGGWGRRREEGGGGGVINCIQNK